MSSTNLTIFDLVKIMPNSKANAFTLNDHNNIWYFMVEDPLLKKALKPQSVRAIVRVLGFNVFSGALIDLTIKIKNEDKIKALLSKDFYNEVLRKRVFLEKDPIKHQITLLEYDKWGFTLDKQPFP